MLKLVSANICGDQYLDKVIPFLQKENADVVCIQETIENDIPTLAGNIYPYRIFAPMFYMQRAPKMPLNGLLILSKDKPQNIEIRYYVGNKDHFPVFGNDPTKENRGIIVCTIQKDIDIFNIATTHFTWSPDGKTTDIQRKHFLAFKNILKNLNNIILCGDFNAPRGKEIFTELSNIYKDNVPLSVTSTIDPILHRKKDLDLVVDGLFTSKHYNAQETSIVEGISDHKVIVATIKKLAE